MRNMSNLELAKLHRDTEELLYRAGFNNITKVWIARFWVWFYSA